MADNSFGLSFSPTGDPRNKQQGGADPTQTSIQTLGLSIPHVVGASPVAPGALLNAPGGGGLNLQALLALLFGSRNPSLFGGGGGAQTGLTPKVTPVGVPPQGGPMAGGPYHGPSNPGPLPHDFPMPGGGGPPLLELPQSPQAPSAPQMPQRPQMPQIPMGGMGGRFGNQS